MASLVPLSPKAKRFLNANKQAQAFRAAIKIREAEAAKLATTISRGTYHTRIPRPVAPPRKGRPTTDGLFADYINWQPSSAHKGFIDFDTATMKAKAPYFLIQEIGTNRTAKILNPPAVITVRSQIGRTIPYNLYWAAGVGGTAVDARTGASGDQLYLASEINAASLKNVKSRRKRIRREIKGKHYLQAGGAEGFRYLGETLVADARKIFR